MKKEPYNIPSFDDSVKSDFKKGLITIEEAAEAFFVGGHTNYIDLEYTQRKLNQ